MIDDLESTSRTDRSKKYLLGTDGWIFLDQDSNRVIDQITGRYALDAAGLDDWVTLIEGRDAYAASIGARHLMFVAPNKELVYSENLPSHIEIATDRPVQQIMTALDPERARQIIYPLDAIREGKGQGIVYPRTDTHWSGLGAYIGYQALCDGLSDCGIEPLRLDPSRLSFATVDFVGDLGVKLEPQVSAPTLSARIAAPSGRLAFDNRIPNRGRIRVFVNRDATLPRCVMFGDSFGGNLLPYLKESFSTLVYVYGKTFDRELIEAYRPDVVLAQFVERFLVEPPVDTASFTYVSVVRDKLKLLTPVDLIELDGQVATVDPAIFPLAPIYEALLRAQAGHALSADLVGKLEEHHADNPEAQHLLSVELSRTGDRLDAAHAFATRAVAAEPWNGRSRHQLALTLMRLDRPDLAEIELRKAIALKPGVDWWSYQLSQVLFRQQKFDAAIAELRPYIARHPRSPDAWQLLARSHEGLNHVEDAADAYEKAAATKPDWVWPLLKLANLRANTGTQPEAGLRATDTLLAFTLEPRKRAEIHMVRARLHELLNNRPEAIEEASHCAALAPDWDWAQVTLERLRGKGRESAAAG
ncbi:tetratricopeptide repeat protein [Microvirga antarctica]|uniref:tetratricopeptide repeat protein n=1 Tax=Microvirga antarctica TaxID=2819233 RepID=UPI001B317C7A|nr:tetratricopeptide repeat protein [Microvirga antarctica]